MKLYKAIAPLGIVAYLFLLCAAIVGLSGVSKPLHVALAGTGLVIATIHAIVVVIVKRKAKARTAG